MDRTHSLVLSCRQLCTWLLQQDGSLTLALFLLVISDTLLLIFNNLCISYKSLQYVYNVVLLVQKKYFCIILIHVCWGSFSKGMNFIMQLLKIFRSENFKLSAVIFFRKTGKLPTVKLFNFVSAIGFNVETVTYKNLKFQVWDLGGQTSIR